MAQGSLPDPASIDRSWHTRMASVLRQFKLLTQSPVLTETGKVVEVIGLVQIGDQPKLTICNVLNHHDSSLIELKNVRPCVSR